MDDETAAVTQALGRRLDRIREDLNDLAKNYNELADYVKRKDAQ